jgi:hypothetical protein
MSFPVVTDEFHKCVPDFSFRVELYWLTFDAELELQKMRMPNCIEKSQHYISLSKYVSCANSPSRYASCPSVSYLSFITDYNTKHAMIAATQTPVVNNHINESHTLNQHWCCCFWSYEIQMCIIFITALMISKMLALTCSWYLLEIYKITIVWQRFQKTHVIRSLIIYKALLSLKTPKHLAGSCCLYSFIRCQFSHVEWDYWTEVVQKLTHLTQTYFYLFHSPQGISHSL